VKLPLQVVHLLLEPFVVRQLLLELSDTPLDRFVFGVNPGTVWIAGIAAGVLGPRRAMVGAATLGIPGVNAVAHIMPALRTQTYNPGLLTAIVLFVPMCVWIFRALVKAGLLDRARVALAMVSGVLLHMVLMGSLFDQAFRRFTQAFDERARAVYGLSA
jgi:hypothetical protein